MYRMILAFFGLLLLGACSEKNELYNDPETEWFPCVVAEKNHVCWMKHKAGFLNHADMADYEIHYIGKKQSVIHSDPFFRFTLDSLDYLRLLLPGESGEVTERKNDRFNKNNAAHAIEHFAEDKYIYSMFAFQIRIDTSQLIADSYPVIMINQWDDTVKICLGNFLPVWLEAKNKHGQWHPLENRHFYGCGTGLKTMILPPKEIVLSFLKKPHGNFKTEVRLTTGFVHSNSIHAMIQEKSLQQLPSYE